MAFEQVTVDRFSGGITDYFVDSDPSFSKTLDNFVLTPNEKVETRNGSTLFDSNHHTVLAAGNPRIGSIINFDKDTKLLVQINSNLYYTSGTWAALLGPIDSNVVFGRGSTSSYISHSQWNKHLYLTDDQFSQPVKVYQDESGALQVRTAGLESLELTGAINLANSLKTKFNAHIADSTGEHILADALHTIAARTAYDLQSLIDLVTELLTDYAAHRLDATLGTPTYHVATSAGNALSSTSAPRTLSECLARLDDLKAKFNAHDADAVAHGATSNYQVTVSRSPTFTPSAGANTYLYKILYYYTYQVGTVIFEDFGPTTDFSVTSAAAPNSSSISITNIPVLSNNSVSSIGSNYDTANVKKFIYRTTAGGTVYYKLAELTNATTSYTDSTADTTLDDNEQLYTNGGVVDNDQPPPAKYVHIVNGIGYYAHVKEGSQILKNRLLQSIPDDPDSVPADFIQDFDDEITGISSINGKLVVLTTKTAYRVTENFDELGRGGMNIERILDAVGCVSHQSIVQTISGLFYAGADGFYFTDAYQVKKLSVHLSDTYKAITNSQTKQLRIVGTYEEQNQRIYWTIKSNDSSPDNDKLIVLDLRFGIKEASCFTTWSGGDSFSPTSICFFNKELVRADRRGYLLKHQDGLTNDKKIDTSVTPSSWVNQTIIWTYESPSSSLGSSQARKFVNRIIFQSKNNTNASVAITSNNDQNRIVQSLKEIRFRGNITWGDPEVIWGDPDVIWGGNGVIEALRRFPHGGLRCSYKQVKFTNAFTNITKSDTVGLASINATTKTVTLLSSSIGWPVDVVDYYISFAADSYATNYLVTSRTSNAVLTYQDASNTSSTSASSKWIIRGYPKGERLHLLKYVIEFVPLTDSQEPYKNTTTYTGTNA